MEHGRSTLEAFQNIRDKAGHNACTHSEEDDLIESYFGRFLKHYTYRREFGSFDNFSEYVE